MRLACVLLLFLSTTFSARAQNFTLDSLATDSLAGIGFSTGVWGDFDGDSRLDFAVVGLGLSGPTSGISLNQGGSSFDFARDVLLPVTRGNLSAADYDNDNDVDLLLSGFDVNGLPVTRLYNNDAGTFGESSVLLANIGNGSSAWGDLNVDGRLDLLVAGQNADGNSVSLVYRNDGGSFTEIGANLPGFQEGMVAWGDFNADGLPDIFLQGRNVNGQADAKLFFNKGDETFAEVATSIPGMIASSAMFGDYNSDADLDLLMTGLTADSVLTTKIYRNDGTGTFFEVPQAEFVPLAGGSAAWGDLDNDGDLDVLLTGSDADSVARSLVYFNEGNDVFTLSASQLAGVSDGFGALADYDLDGDLDIALFGTDTTGMPVGLLYSNNTNIANTRPSAPTGLLTELTTTGLRLSWQSAKDVETDSLGLTYNLRVGTTPGGSELWTAMALGGGDRLAVARGNLGPARLSVEIELATVKSAPEIYWSVQAIDNNFAGSSFATEQPFLQAFFLDSIASETLPGVNASELIWGDCDGDGDLDLLLTGQSVANERIAELILNNGQGQFEKSSQVFEGVASGASGWTDYDNDGDLDVLVCGITAENQDVCNLYTNNGAGDFELTSTDIEGVQQGNADWGDYDNDGDQDLLLAGFSGSAIVAKIYQNNGGTFTDINAGLVGVLEGVAVWADFDTDGNLDVLLAGSSASGTVTNVYKNTDGVFIDQELDLPGFASSAASIGDYDKDGDVDILICGSIAGTRVTRIFENNGNFTFTIPDVDLPGISNGSISWLDFDSDGDLDVALAGFDNNFSRISAVYRNDGDGVFASIDAFLEGAIFGSLAVADYDGDNDQDLVLTGSSAASRIAHVYKNLTNVANIAPTAPSIGQADFTNNTLTFNWGTASDEESMDRGLTYNLRVGSTPGAVDIVAPISLAEGERLIPSSLGNAGGRRTRTIQIDNIRNKQGVYWSVQALDSQGAGSVFSEEGSFAGEMISVEDVPFDQGNRVTVKWKASSLDYDVNRLTSYSVWRALPVAGSAVPQVARRSSVLTKSRPIRQAVMAGENYAWEWVATLPAHREPEYSYTAKTLYDSMSTTNGMHHFFVSAHTNDANLFFDSQPDSGFSVDNLAPAAPTQLAGQIDGGHLLLTWESRATADFKQFAVFKSTASEVALAKRELLGGTRTKSFIVPLENLHSGDFLVVVAQDSSDNYSKPSNEFSWTVTSVAGSAIPNKFALHQNFPNPFNPVTRIDFDLPLSSHVKIDVFSVLGAHVATLVNARLDAGKHQVDFDGRNIASGTYFYRIKTEAYVQVRKMILLR